jgi:hypothetical protein
MIITDRSGRWVLRLTALAILLAGAVAALTGYLLASRDVVGMVPMGTQTAVYAGPCTVQPLQLSGTCRTERGQS